MLTECECYAWSYKNISALRFEGRYVSLVGRRGLEFQNVWMKEKIELDYQFSSVVYSFFQYLSNQFRSRITLNPLRNKGNNFIFDYLFFT